MREFKIACARHRKAKTWKNVSTTWPDLRARLCATTYTAETQDEYWAMSKDDRDAAKDRGSFVGGFLTGIAEGMNIFKMSTLFSSSATEFPLGLS